MTPTDRQHLLDEMDELLPVSGSFRLPALPYGYADLEPVIDGDTMILHHDKHHEAYVEGLNRALASAPSLAGKDLVRLLEDLDAAPPSVRMAIRNMGGGHFNHCFFWRCMNPRRAGSVPGSLRTSLVTTFGSLQGFMDRFAEAGSRHFGSGWVWLCVNTAQGNRLEIVTLPNQDSWIGSPLRGLLTCDLWEHAYYLRYHNRRADWMKEWWQVVDWQAVDERYRAVMESADMSRVAQA